ncbi:DUF998 domain-containing protein [Streptomyces marincola]|uniref:DUF998 domain-containing protein n=1 Tax=Streptomyces marincola TaxID=2878388 RepID=UPI00384E7892
MTVSQVRAPYSLLHNTISDAGAATCTSVSYPWGPVPVCSPLSWLLNAVTILSGVTLAAGAVLLHRWFPAGRSRTWATGMAAVSGLSLIGTGLVPLDVNLALHALVAAPQLLTFPALLLFLASVLRDVSRSSSRTCVVAAAVSTAGTVAFLLRVEEPLGGGMLERTALWPLYLALVPIGLVLSRAGRVAGRP